MNIFNIAAPYILPILCNAFLGVILYFGNINFVKAIKSRYAITYYDTIPDKIKYKNSRFDTIEKYHSESLQLEKKIKELKVEIEINKIKLSNIYQYLSNEYRISGNKAYTEKFKNYSFVCYEVSSDNLGFVYFFLYDLNGCNVSSLSNLNTITRNMSKLLVFATNGGMYTNDHKPVGLYIENGKIITNIDTQKGLYGNFYMQPNGVFYIDTCMEAGIVTTEIVNSVLINKMKFATQSGPMLVVDSMININFKEGSTNVNIRSGVGIKDNGNIVFVISNEKINFYDFAAFFKFNLKCSDALYLDGAISETYLPELGRRQNGGSFGPMIGVIK